MRRIGTYGKTVVLLALIVCAVGVSLEIKDEIVVADTHFSNGHFDEECRLKMSLIAYRLVPLKRNEYHSDISWLHLEKPLPFVYLVSENRKSYLLTCQDTHHKREGVVLCPVTTEKGYGLVKGPLELKAPYSDFENLPLREFLGIPRFNGSHIVHRMGRFNVLVVAVAGDEDEEVIVMTLNPDSDLKSLYEGSLYNGLPIGKFLSEEDRAAIIRKYRVEDPFVLERLKPTWNQEHKHPQVNGLSVGQQKRAVLKSRGKPDGEVEYTKLTGLGVTISAYDVDRESTWAELIVFYSYEGDILSVTGTEFVDSNGLKLSRGDSLAALRARFGSPDNEELLWGKYRTLLFEDSGFEVVAQDEKIEAVSIGDKKLRSLIWRLGLPIP